MNFIAPKDFNQGSDNPLKIPGGGMHVKMGTVFSIGEGATTVEELEPEDLRIYRTFSAAGCLCPLESNRGQHVLAEVERLRELEECVTGAQGGCSSASEWWKKPAGIFLLVAVSVVIVGLIATVSIRYFR